MAYSQVSAILEGEIIADRHEHWAENDFQVIIRTRDNSHVVTPITSIPPAYAHRYILQQYDRHLDENYAVFNRFRVLQKYLLWTYKAMNEPELNEYQYSTNRLHNQLVRENVSSSYLLHYIKWLPMHRQYEYLIHYNRIMDHALPSFIPISHNTSDRQNQLPIQPHTYIIPQIPLERQIPLQSSYDNDNLNHNPQQLQHQTQQQPQHLSPTSSHDDVDVIVDDDTIQSAGQLPALTTPQPVPLPPPAVSEQPTSSDYTHMNGYAHLDGSTGPLVNGWVYGNAPESGNSETSFP